MHIALSYTDQERYQLPAAVGREHPLSRDRRSTTRRAGIAFFLLASLIASACSNGSSEGSATKTSPEGQAEDARPEDQTLTVHIFRQKPNLDPGQQTNGGALIGQYVQALMRQGPNGDVAPGAAAGFDVSPDQLTYTFRLRPDGMFNDGTPVTGSDFVFAWRRLIDPRLAAPSSDQFAGAVKGGRAAASLPPDAADPDIDAALDTLGLATPDPSTFVVTLEQPLPYFKYIAALPSGAPIRKAVVDEFGSSTWASDLSHLERIVTNGPFKIAEIIPPNEGPTAGPIVMAPNPSFTPKPSLTKITNTRGFGPGKLDALWSEYLTGQRDLVQGPTPGPTRTDALNDPKFEPQLYRPFLGEQVYLAFNTAKVPFDNVNVRRAFAQSIDREAANEPNGALPGETRPATSLVPQGVPGYSADVGESLEFNCNSAKASLAASGFTANTLPPVTLTLISGFDPDLNFVRTQVKNCLGIDTQVSTPVDDVNAQQDDYQAYVSVNAKPTYPDPQELFQTLLPTNPAAITKWTGAVADSYASTVQEANASDAEIRLGLFGDAQDVVIEDVPVTFLYEYSRPNWIQTWVKGIVKGLPFDNASLPGSTYSEQIKIAKH